jgi:ribosomal protein S18 acetylase RimI-like enzyme
MNSVRTTPSRRKTAPGDWNRLSTIFSFSFAVIALTLLVEKSQCFVPSSVTFPTNNHRAEISFVRLRLTEIETNKNKEVEIGEKYNPYSNQEIKKSKQKEFADIAAAIDIDIDIETAVSDTTKKYSIQPFDGIDTHRFPTTVTESPRNEMRLKRNEKLGTSRPIRNKSTSSSMHRNMTTVINDLGDSWSKNRLFRDLRSELRFETKNVYKKSSGRKSFENLKPYNNGVDYDNNLPRKSLEESCRALIESTVEDMMKSSTESRSMGLFGEATHSDAAYYNYIPKAGTILARSIEKSPSSKNKKSSSDNTIVRMASHMDDIDIANLRLSVFSNFTPESLKIFCDRSCQLLSTRRQRGANCIVATNSKNKKDGKGPIIGTAEISFHEFTETGLGYTRPKNSILYITEVAVDAAHRRKGIAKLMLEAIDNVANIRDVETIYLHVDVTNVGAVHLYETAGYKIVASDNPIFNEFTKKLNLHDGATKGRNHHLLAKDLRRPTWLDYQEWLNYQEYRLNYEEHIDEAHAVSPQPGILGFEVPAVV